MGNTLVRFFKSVFGDKDYRILMLGLDAAGKTSILNRLKLNENLHTIPTIGFNMEQVQIPGTHVSFTMWDVGGQAKIRHLWKHYYHGTHGLIFVVDSGDRDRLSCSSGQCFNCARDELRVLMEADELRSASVLILANKQDLQGARSPTELREVLELDSICRGHSWFVQPCCAVTGDGIVQGMHWLAEDLKHRRVTA